MTQAGATTKKGPKIADQRKASEACRAWKERRIFKETAVTIQILWRGEDKTLNFIYKKIIQVLKDYSHIS